ncbi:HAD-superfamily hydrolase, subfamily IA [Glaciecola sp. KUL10]|nr:HAD-superfamily hydrolase, subfamily IA [Glaciecola sp. KUL10]
MIVYKPILKIKAMSFDLDDTLYDNWPYIVEAEKRLYAYLAKNYAQTDSISKSDWQGFKRSALIEDPQLCSDMGELRKITLTKGLSQAGYQGEALNHAVKDCFDYFYFERSNFKVPKDICEVLEKLSNHLPLVAITNGNVNLEQIGISDFFVKIYKASRQQPMKPDSYMFDAAATYLKIPPAQILHVGDNLKKDVWAATNAGYKSAWFAVNRNMDLSKEKVELLPNVQLTEFSQLLKFI